MNIEWTITSGQLALAGSFLILAWRIFLIHRAVIVFVAEHDLMADWYAAEHQMERAEMRQVAVVHQANKAKAARR